MRGHRVRPTGSVWTEGDGSHGVLLQTVGGGDGGAIDYSQTATS